MNRGSIRESGASLASMPGFNEAPIHESGKSERSVLRLSLNAPLQ